jgi:hypothetical protein
MKRFIYIALTAFAAAAIASACQVSAGNVAHRDWRGDMALMGNDMAVLLKYQPTDQATYAGHIRQSMNPGKVQ